MKFEIQCYNESGDDIETIIRDFDDWIVAGAVFVSAYDMAYDYAYAVSDKRVHRIREVGVEEF